MLIPSTLTFQGGFQEVEGKVFLKENSWFGVREAGITQSFEGKAEKRCRELFQSRTSTTATSRTPAEGHGKVLCCLAKTDVQKCRGGVFEA